MTILISVRKRLLMKYLTSDFFSIYNSNFNTNGKIDLFYDQIHSVCKTHIPYKRLSKEVKIFSKPWITREILTKMNYRDKLYSKITEKGISLSPYFTSRVTTQDQFSYPLSLQMKFGLVLVRGMLTSLLAHTVYLILL